MAAFEYCVKCWARRGSQVAEANPVPDHRSVFVVRRSAYSGRAYRFSRAASVIQFRKRDMPDRTSSSGNQVHAGSARRFRFYKL